MLTDVITALGEMQVGVVKCRYLDTADLQVDPADCPLRIIVPIVESDGEFVAIGSMEGTTWSIHDVLLWRPITKGSARQDIEGMCAYVDDYLETLKAKRSPTSSSWIVGWKIFIGPIAWAEQVADFRGVDITLAIQEAK